VESRGRKHSHQPTKAMSETIQRYECGSNCMSADAEGYYVTFEDHQSALTAAQAEVERLKGVHAAIAGWISDNIEWKDEEELKELLATGFGWIDELRGMAWEEIEAKKAENAALKRELEEARAEIRAAKEECAACTAAVDANIGEQVAEENGILRFERDQLQSRVVELESRLKNE
jgi:predicted RNase H-like nuclease (RuvC/YqgF family)